MPVTAKGGALFEKEAFKHEDEAGQVNMKKT